MKAHKRLGVEYKVGQVLTLDSSKLKSYGHWAKDLLEVVKVEPKETEDKKPAPRRRSTKKPKQTESDS